MLKSNILSISIYVYDCETNKNLIIRRMFPTVRSSVSGLEPAQQYFVLLDIVLAEDNRYKYTGKEWQVAGKAEPQLPARQV